MGVDAYVSMVCVQFLHLPSLLHQNHHMVEMRTPVTKGCMVSCLSYVTFAFFEDVSVKGLPFSAEPRPPASHLESTSYAEIAQQHIQDLETELGLH